MKGIFVCREPCTVIFLTATIMKTKNPFAFLQKIPLCLVSYCVTSMIIKLFIAVKSIIFACSAFNKVPTGLGAKFLIPCTCPSSLLASKTVAHGCPSFWKQSYLKMSIYLKLQQFYNRTLTQIISIRVILILSAHFTNVYAGGSQSLLMVLRTSNCARFNKFFRPFCW